MVLMRYSKKVRSDFDADLEICCWTMWPKAPLFRSVASTGALTEKPMNRIDAWRMIRRHSANHGTGLKIGCHTFRATGITA